MNTYLQILLLLLFSSNLVVGQSNFTYTTFEGNIFEYNGRDSQQYVPNAQVEIYLGKYSASKAKYICDCENGEFSCSVNVKNDQRVILVFRATGYTSKVKEFNVKMDEDGERTYFNVVASLIKNDKTAGIKLADQNGEIKIFDQPKFELGPQNTSSYFLDSVYINKIEVAEKNVKGKYLYYPNEVVDANGLWFHVTYQTDPNNFGNVKEGFVYFHYSEEFQNAKDKAYILAKTHITTFKEDNKGSQNKKGVVRGKIYPIAEIDTKNNLLLLGGINKWIRNDQSRFILLSEREVLANNGKL